MCDRNIERVIIEEVVGWIKSDQQINVRGGWPTDITNPCFVDVIDSSRQI